MRIHKTEKARAELLPGIRTLGQRERSMLLLADGQNTVNYFSSLFNGEGQKLVLQLLRDGYLTGTSQENPVLSSKTSDRLPSPSPKTLTDPPLSAEPQVVKLVADQFDGKRSLATTRMFLFDICERMFARRSPALAESFREALRNARDRESMLAAGREMIAEIEKIAGHERADSISERIAMLLPPEA